MISLCMIVKNEEKYLKECLDSVKGIADEIIIVDTGSDDNTKKIALASGAKVYDFVWIGDFSAARNFALGFASGDWILYLDADERLAAASIEELKRITSGPSNAAVRCNVISIDDVKKQPSVMSYVRLFPSGKHIRFRGKIHEQIEDCLIENGYPVQASSIEILHVGYNVPENEIIKKAERNLQLLVSEYNSTGRAYYAFQLGQTYGIINKTVEAEFYFLKSLEKPAELTKEYRSIAYRYLAITAAQKHEFTKSLGLIEKSITEDDTQPLALMAAAKIYMQMQQYEKAVQSALKAYDANQNVLAGGNSSAQNIKMDDEEICYHGLEVAVSCLDKSAFNFFFDKIRNKNPHACVFKALYNNTELDKAALESFISGFSPAYLTPLLLLIDKYTFYEAGYDLLTQLLKCCAVPEVYVKLAQVAAVLNKNEEAEKHLENAISLNPGEASLYFYLISICLKTGNVKKITSALMLLQKKFKSNPEVSAKVNLLKQKLSAAINV